MKLQLKLDQLARLDLSGAVRLLMANAKKIEGAAEPIPVLIFGEHQYPDPKFKGKTLPLFLIGEYSTDWKMEFNSRKRKDASAGQCVVKAGVIQLELTEGRPVRGEVLKDLNLLMRQARFTLEIKESLVDEEGGAEAPAGNTGAPVKETSSQEKTTESKGNAKATPEKVAKVKEVVDKQAKRMTEMLDDFREQFKQVKNRVVPKVKKGDAGRSDLVAMRLINKSIEDFAAIYEKAHKGLKSAFANALKDMESQKNMLAGLAKKVKSEKKTLAHQLADTFYMKNKKRPASPDEVATMQESLKAAMEHHYIDTLKGEERQQRLKAIYATAQFRGAYFTVADTDKVYERIAE